MEFYIELNGNDGEILKTIVVDYESTFEDIQEDINTNDWWTFLSVDESLFSDHNCYDTFESLNSDVSLEKVIEFLQYINDNGQFGDYSLLEQLFNHYTTIEDVLEGMQNGLFVWGSPDKILDSMGFEDNDLTTFVYTKYFETFLMWKCAKFEEYSSNEYVLFTG